MLRRQLPGSSRAAGDRRRLADQWPGDPNSSDVAQSLRRSYRKEECGERLHAGHPHSL